MLAVISTGSVSVDYPDKRWRESHDDLTEVTQTFQRTGKATIQIGDLFPGESDYVVINREIEDEPDGVSVIRATGIGAAGGLVELPGTEVENEEGWDEVTREYITTNKEFVKRGSSLLGYAAMRCTTVNRRRHPRSSYHWILSATYRGMIKRNKEPKVRWTSSGREISKDSLTNLLPGGWNDPQRSQVLWPRQGITVSYVSDKVPNVAVPFQNGANRPHPQAPFVFSPSIAGPASEFTFHWPNGWVLLGMDTDILPGTTIAFVVENWVWNDRIVLG